MRQLILATIGLALIVFSFFALKFFIDMKNKKRPTPKKVVKTVFIDTVKNKTIPIIIPANGNLTAKKRVEIYAEVQGILDPELNFLDRDKPIIRDKTLSK